MSVEIAAVTAEHHESGFAIGHASPRLSWRFAATSLKGWKQSGYELVITREGKDETYNVTSTASVLVPWPSSPLKSREVAHIKVRAIAIDKTSTSWASLTIEAALLQRSDWKAALISRPPQIPDEPKPPFRVFRTFSLDSVPKTARLYSTAHGLYEVTINGVRVGDHVLAPGWQSYRHHLNYQTYNIGSLLRTGENTIEAYIGEGWFAGRLGRPGERNLWGDRLGFLGQLEADGQIVVVSNEDWQYRDGPVKSAEIYNGETYDSTKSSYPALGPVDVLSLPAAELVASDAPPVRRILEIKPLEIITTPSGKKVLNFGQNLVGWLRLEKDLAGKAGDKVVIRHAEVLEHGELGTRPLRTARATDEIILGGPTKGWEPKFTFHGFQYAEITGVSDLDLKTFTAVVVTSDMRRTGHFSCSHSMINRLHKNVEWGMIGNFVSVPTDCPQRDERLGWTGDIQVFAPTANFLYDTSGFLGGWLKDVAAEQKDFDGIVPTVVPFLTNDPKAGPRPKPQGIWADATIITPHDLYTTFGDKEFLQKQFESMCLWLDKGVPRDPVGLFAPDVPQYGDWLDPYAPPSFPAHGRTDTHLTVNAYLVYVTGLVSEIATLLGHEVQAAKYASDYSRLRQLFQTEYITTPGRLVSDTQTSFVLALRFGLLEPNQIENATKRLEWLIRWNHFKISTGFAGTPIILPVLADNGLLSLAYRMLQERDNPSWLYSVGMGATTIWERWDSMLVDGTINPGKSFCQMTSFNHYALGSVAAFLHNTVGGLAPAAPGWREALIRPQPGGTITSASVSFDSPYGPYSVSWLIEGGKLKVDAAIPPNGSATVVLPGLEDKVGSGEYHYEVNWEADPTWPPKGMAGPQKLLMPDEFVP
ncbi:bacterial alpha-L-rhamnosidase-domain-containing protein [Naematelia encephala]|uniref:alpha-L-rhamnosidase n=1 Tax=Naematelia encephala TaxID=71784 RepID=A0A1Y2AYP1_9TREE|nr:bacterial alpha-L-rhamnosidase-domain-containing protein [Naematelia encephala]